MTILVENLNKTFKIRQTKPGLLSKVKSLFNSHTIEILAIDKLSFSIKEGERVAFIGPNGAGKSTTIKMLTGILFPTSGIIKVLDFVPWKERHLLGYKIGTVFGQRSQLWYNLPPLDTFELLAKIYELNPKQYKIRLDELTEIFELNPLLLKPVRQLSLGERMRCEIVASLLHRPKILFLDEPTIGLDINAKLLIRDLLNRLSQEHGTTLFLTSHDPSDIEQVCERVIILDKGKIVKDSSIKELKKTAIKKKILTLVTEEESFALNLPGILMKPSSKHHFICEVDPTVMPIEKVIQEALKKTNVKDINIEDPSMEEIIREIYASRPS